MSSAPAHAPAVWGSVHDKKSVPAGVPPAVWGSVHDTTNQPPSRA